MRVLQLSRLPDFFTRFDLTIRGTHNFVANGMVVHNTSSHVVWNQGRVGFFSGGASYPEFVKLFDADKLAAVFQTLDAEKVTVYGEAYGGKLQGMSATYGKALKFVAFDVQIGDLWLATPQAEDVVHKLGLEFVSYIKIPTTLEAIDAAMMAPSEQAKRNGMGSDKPREGVVLRPIVEVTLNNGGRVVAKHKRKEFQERENQPKPIDAAKLEILQQAEAIADEWATEMRLAHVLDKFPDAEIEQTREIIQAMIEDIEREAKGEIVESKAARAAIGKRTAQMFKRRLQVVLETKGGI